MASPRSNVDIAFELLLDAAHRTSQGRLVGKILGLVGYGTLGREIARRAVRSGMEVLYADPEPRGGRHKRVLLNELLARSDYVMLLPDAAQDMPHATEVLPYLKPGAHLVRVRSKPAETE
jgi:phosphoglycerate dehydrogenase-like enzyme